jgi:hypothetical protein
MHLCRDVPSSGMSALVPAPPGSISGDFRPSASIRFLPEELSERFQIEWEHYEIDGLGEAAGAAFKASNGQYFAVEHLYHMRTLGRHGSGLITLFRSPAEAETIDAALCDLELTSEDLTWLRDDIQFTPCDLVRQDDHGNQFTVGTYRCRADATAMIRHLTASAHKQDYWIHDHAAEATAVS